jgi:pimeloyl-ACP methyl ester carboxylesterase
MQCMRTHDNYFSDLPDYPWPPNYIDDLPSSVGVRVHYLDVGSHDADTVWLCLHGQPTWSYLYRKMIPVFAAAGHRVIAPDLIGFGRSDKPVDDAVYTFDFHRQMLLELVERLALTNVRLVCQDWGGLLGLTLPMAAPERYNGLLVMNTALATGDLPLGDGFIAWRAYARSQPNLDIAKLMMRSTPPLSPAEAAAYAAPFPDARYKAGVRRFPELVPDHPDAGGAAISRDARTWWRERWSGKSLMAIGMQDPVLGPPSMHYLHKQIRGCPPPMELAEAGHFVQEWGDTVAKAALIQLD